MYDKASKTANSAKWKFPPCKRFPCDTECIGTEYMELYCTSKNQKPLEENADLDHE